MTTLSTPRRWRSRTDTPPKTGQPQRRSRPWHLYLLTALGVGLFAMAITQIGSPASSARTSTQIVTAQKGIVQSTVSGTGNIEAGTDLNLNFQTSGTLSAVDVKVGQHVRKGQLLATLDPTNAQLALDQADSQLTAAEDQLSSAESGSSTSTSSAGGGSTTGSSGSTSGTSSSSSIATAQAAVDSAQASVNAARTGLDGTKLYAPVSGTIASLAGLSKGDTVTSGTTGSSSATSGGSTSSGGSSSSTSAGTGTSAGGLGSAASTSSTSSSGSTPFAQIVNTSTMTMTVSFSESDINKLKVGQAATVTPDAVSGVQLAGHVTSISPVGTTSNNVVSYQATLTLNQSDSRVKPGMSASATVVTGQANGVNVPNAAVTGTGSSGTVTVLRNGKQKVQQVVVGLRGSSRTQIVSGLSAGQQVVIKIVLPPLNSATAGSSSPSGTLGGGTSGRPGGFGGGGGGFAGGGFAGGGFAGGGFAGRPTGGGAG